LKLEPKSPLDEAILVQLLRGRVPEGSVSRSRTIVRLFTSSTFTDTAIERNFLLKHVFPILSDVCRSLNLDFQVVDMRWGVRASTDNDHGTAALCMSEIRDCLQVSVGPAMWSYLCDKSGYRPLPKFILASELDLILPWIRENRSSAEVEAIEREYNLDTNATPPTYLLRPKSCGYPDVLSMDGEKRGKASGLWWDEVYLTVTPALRLGSAAVLSKDDALKFTMAVTEEEQHVGVLGNPDRDTQCLVYRRTLTGLNIADEGAHQYQDKIWSPPGIDTEAQDLLRELKEVKIPGAVPAHNIRDFAVPWAAGGLAPLSNSDHYAHMVSFCSHFLRDIGGMIVDGVRRTNTVKDELVEELCQQNAQVADKCKSFVGRADLLAKIASYVASDSPLPFVVVGESGVGKTAVLAKAFDEQRKAAGDAILVVRMLGTTGQSGTSAQVLRGICQQIFRAVGDSEAVKNIPVSYQALVKQFADVLALGTEARPLVLFLDSLDQLSQQDGGLELGWIPQKLPPHARLVLSTLPDTPAVVFGCETALHKRNIPDENFMRVQRLHVEDGPEVLDAMLSARSRQLTPEQREVVLGAFNQCPLPLFMSLCVHMAARWHSFDPGCTLRSDVQTLIREQLFGQLEEKHGEVLVRTALGLLTVAKKGLTAVEMEHCLSLDDPVLNSVMEWWDMPVLRVPPSLWMRLRSDLGGFLIERGGDDRSPFKWYHRQFWEVANACYTSAANGWKQYLHRSLAEFFAGTWAAKEKSFVKVKDGSTRLELRQVPAQPLILSGDISDRDCVVNLRRLTELVHHYTLGECWPELEDALCDLDTIQAMSLAGRAMELNTQFAAAEAGGAEWQDSSRVEHYRKFVANQCHVFNRFPTMVLQQACNLPDHTYPAVDATFQLGCSQWWFRQLSKQSSADPCTAVLEHEDRVKTAAMTTDRRRILTAAGPDVCVWNAQVGTMLGKLPHEVQVTALALVNGGADHVVVTGTKAGLICLWNFKDQKLQATLQGHKSCVESLAIAADGRKCVSGASDAEFRVWDLQNLEPRGVAKGLGMFEPKYDVRKNERINRRTGQFEMSESKHQNGWDETKRRAPGPIVGVGISADGVTAVSGSSDGILSVWDLSKQEPALRGTLTKMPARNSGHSWSIEVEEVALTADGSTCVTTVAPAYCGDSNDTIYVWDLMTLTLAHSVSFGYQPPTIPSTSLALTKDGAFCVTGSNSGHFVLWDLKEKKIVTKGQGAPAGGKVSAFALTDDASVCLTAAADNALRVWDVQALHASSAEREEREARTGNVNRVTMSPTGQRVMTVAKGQYSSDVQVWDVSQPQNPVKTPTRASIHDKAGSLAFSEDATRAVVSSIDDLLFIYVHEGVVGKASAERIWGNGLAVAMDGAGRWAVQGTGNLIRLWDLEKTVAVAGADSRAKVLMRATLEGHEGEVMALAVTPDGTTCVSGSGDNELFVWDLTKIDEHTPPDWWGLKVVKVLESSPASSAGVVPGKEFIVGNDQRYFVYSGGGYHSELGADFVRTLRKWQGPLTLLLYNIDTRTIRKVTLEYDGDRDTSKDEPEVRDSGVIHETAESVFVSAQFGLGYGTRVRLVTPPEGYVPGEDRKRANSSGCGTVFEEGYKVPMAALVSRLVGHTGQIVSVGISADASTCVSGATDGTVSVWNCKDATRRFVIPQPAALNCLALSDSGRILVAVIKVAGGAVRAWDLTTLSEAALAPVAEFPLPGVNSVSMARSQRAPRLVMVLFTNSKTMEIVELVEPDL